MRDEDTASELHVIQEAAGMLGHSSDPEPTIHGMLHLCSQFLGLNRGRVLLPEGGNGRLRIRYAYGLTEGERERGTYELGEGITGEVMATGRVAVVQDVDEEPRFLFRAVDRSTLPDETVAYIAVPVEEEGAVIGVLGVHRLRSRPRALHRDLAILGVIAGFVAQALRIQRLIAEQTARLESENRVLREQLDGQGADFGILGRSPALQGAVRQARQVADTDVGVLLRGESGTGKEKFARMLHLASGRREAPFIALNCAAIPENLLESELFGHEKGAFTGATSARQGRLEQAHGGTLFLDEIGDLGLELQAKLLRLLEDGSIQRVGGSRAIPVDVRFITATHKNLQEAVNAGDFRLDLYYRLNVFPLTLPPLRERVGDVRLLAHHFLNLANQEYGRNVILPEEALTRLEGYGWPGNIRQLENVIKRAVLLAPADEITAGDIARILGDEEGIGGSEAGPVPGEASMPSPVPVAADGMRPYARVRADEAEQIRAALRETGGNKTRAALSLGLTPRQLRYRLAKLGIEV